MIVGLRTGDSIVDDENIHVVAVKLFTFVYQSVHAKCVVDADIH